MSNLFAFIIGWGLGFILGSMVAFDFVLHICR